MRRSVGTGFERMTGRGLASIALIGVCGASWVLGCGPAASQTVLRGTVLEVKDGDSLVVRLESGPVEVRLHAADAPEYDQPGGRQAQAALRQRLPRGAVVTLEPVEQDRYSRLVATVFEDEQNVDQWLVREGHAWAYRYHTDNAEYCVLEDEARRAQRGVWALPAAQRVAPWDWRARKRDATHRVHDYTGETLERCLAALRRGASTSTAAGAVNSTPRRAERASGYTAAPRAEAAPPDPACRIKGNIGSGGRKVYHVPGSASYEATRIDPAKGERWFCSVAEAERAGWRK